MFSQLRLHVRAHLKFFLRNRLVLGLVLAATAFWAVGFVAFLMFESSGGRFARLRYLSSQMHGLVWFYGALLALVAMSAHLRDRSTRLLFTRPSPPEVWIVSVFAATLMVTAVGHGMTAVATFVLSVAWGIPYQMGFLWLALDSIVEGVVIVSMLGALAVGIHPVLAAMVMLFFNDDMIYFMYSTMIGMSQAGAPGFWVSGGTFAAQAIFTVLPMLDPFGNETAAVNASLRVRGADWAYLVATAAYSGLVASFCFFAATFTLRRRTL